MSNNISFLLWTKCYVVLYSHRTVETISVAHSVLLVSKDTIRIATQDVVQSAHAQWLVKAISKTTVFYLS